jgi:hypothetical protein
MIEAAINSILTTTAGITAITTSIFPVNLPQGTTPPAIWADYKIVAGSNKPAFGTGGMFRTRIGIDCWAARYLDATNLRAAVIAALHGYTDGSISILYLSAQDFFDDVLLQYRALVEVYVWSA